MKQIHDYAKFFPPMEGEEFKALCQDVKTHGLLNPIVLHEDKILDGRNRARACDEVGVRPKYESLANGINAFDYVISQNVLRRHLTPSQRAILALELEKAFAAEPKANGGRGKTSEPRIVGLTGPGHTRAQEARSSAGRAAAALHIGPNLVRDAKRLARDYPDKIKAVRAGKITVGEALVEGLGSRARESAIRKKYQEKRKRLEKTNRQVAEYLEACKIYIVALKIAEDSAERFSKEAVGFVARRHNEIRKLMTELEDALKAA